MCEEGSTRKRYFSFTVRRKYLKSLEDFDIDRVDSRANRWDLPTGGDKGDNCKISSVVEVDNTVKNPFTHTPADKPICVLLSALSALWSSGFKDTAISLMETQREKLHHRTPKLWNKIVCITTSECFETDVMVSD